MSLINSSIFTDSTDKKSIVCKGSMKINASLTPNLKDLSFLIDNVAENSILDLGSDYVTIYGKLIINITESMTIDGHGHTMDLAGGSKHDHYFKVNKGSVTFKNIKFTNGYNKDDDKGGAIFFKSSGVCTLINCIFENCWAEDYGGAVYSVGELRVYNSTFFNNSVENDGGAIYAEGNLILNGTSFVGNSAGDCAGAVDVEGSKAEMSGCVFENNSAEDDGGAAWVNGNLILNGTSFVGNSAGDCGGTVDVEGSKAEINNCTLESNRAGDRSGAVWAKNNLNVFNTTLKNNNAPNAGTIYTGGDLSLVKSNVLYDTAEDDKAIVCKGYITFSI
ncbi:hypothetical protein [uncultured Methanobrevibacter sp.]|uniref:hypothetical protein n=1 Tax=uncultured Methanobrevibacter sp. TaxID=253161 RepID=UPI0025E4EFB7|nr:hypothetical protein [uncultured Methanobrevibacter sp.]